MTTLRKLSWRYNSYNLTIATHTPGYTSSDRKRLKNHISDHLSHLQHSRDGTQRLLATNLRLTSPLSSMQSSIKTLMKQEAINQHNPAPSTTQHHQPHTPYQVLGANSHGATHNRSSSNADYTPDESSLSLKISVERPRERGNNNIETHAKTTPLLENKPVHTTTGPPLLVNPTDRKSVV